MRYYETAVRRGLYRTRDGVICGVVGGIAEYFDTNPFWTRVLAVLLALITGFWPAVIAYAVGALLMKKDPYYRF